MQLYKVKETAEILGCSDRHVWTMIERGHLKKVMIGSTGVRISKADIEAFIARGGVSPDDGKLSEGDE